MNVFDVCCGSSIFSLGFKEAGFDVLGGIDIDKDAIETAKHNDGDGRWEQLSIEDLRNQLEDKKEHVVRSANILLAGLPCQGFSVAGYCDPGDKRNSLYKHLLAITANVKPSYVIIENVKGILAERNRNTFSNIIKGLVAQGYKVDYRLYDAANFGTPQYRQRVFIVASRDIEPRFIFNSVQFSQEQRTVKDALTGLSKKSEDKSINHTFMQHGKAVQKKIAKIYDTKVISYRRLQSNRPSVTITSGHNALPVHPTEHRAISNREAARIQGVPDWFIFTGSRTSQTIQVANAVPFPLSNGIAKAFKRSFHLQNESKGKLFTTIEKGLKDGTRKKISNGFVRFYKTDKRNFPWRKLTDPYKILITEMLLQRTKSETVNKYWSKLIGRIKPLRNGKDFQVSTVRPFFKKLGIFTRAESIKKFNKALHQYYRNRVPSHFDELMQLPGVGIYMASAVRTFAFNIPDFPVDSNAFRFISRFFGVTITGKKAEAKQIREFMNTIIDKKKPDEFAYGFLDFAAKICKPNNPNCANCFLKVNCNYR